MGKLVTLENVLELVKHLSPVDKVRLIQGIVADLERELQATHSTPRKSLRGLWRDLDITEEDIAEARREMWGDFPREDI